MENFLLIRLTKYDFQVNTEILNKFFSSSTTISWQFGDFRFYLSKKSSKFPDNFSEYNNYFIAAIGTFTYKGLSYTQSLKTFLKDEIENKLNLTELYGHYFVFIWTGKKLKLYNDGSGILKAYYDNDLKYLSSSYLLLTKLLRNSITLNKPIIVENLLTGGIIGNETLFKEIESLGSDSAKQFPSLQLIYTNTNADDNSLNSREKILKYSLSMLDNYFSKFKNLADEFGVYSGLTGGYDSRLLLSIIIKYYSKFHVYSHYRSHPSLELDIAKLITTKCNIEFISPQVKSFELMGDEELLSVMNSSCKFYDGQIRMHCNWNEEYNTEEYVAKVSLDKGLGFHGIGGEQYRNADRMYLSSWNFDNWIKYRFIRKFGGTSFNDKKTEQAFCKTIKAKICKQLDFSTNKENLTLLDLKRIENEIYVYSYRGARTNAENKFSFFLSPFADFHISRAAYNIVPYLSSTNNFEIDLIRNFSTELANFPSNYGFAFKNKEPLMKYLGPVVIENFLPMNISYRIRELYKRSRFDKLFQGKLASSELLRKYLKNVIDLDLPVSIDNLLRRPDSAPLVTSLGFFIEMYKSALK
jgi:hypothetical protein